MSELEETDELNKNTELQSCPHGLLGYAWMLTLFVFDVLAFDVKEEVYAPFIQPVCSPYDSSFPWF